MALSFIVTGTAWKWFLDPGIGLAHTMQVWGWESFTFNWIKDGKMAIYCIVIAGVWQSAGFVMALFLAGLRGIDDSIIKAAQVDGASLPRIYWRIIVPTLRPVFFSTLLVLAHIAIKSFDLVVALTSGGPGYATDVPATFMYAMAFSRGQIGLGAASATIMLATIAAIARRARRQRRRRHGQSTPPGSVVAPGFIDVHTHADGDAIGSPAGGRPSPSWC